VQRPRKSVYALYHRLEHQVAAIYFNMQKDNAAAWRLQSLLGRNVSAPVYIPYLEAAFAIKFDNKLMNGKTLRKHNLHEKTAA